MARYFATNSMARAQRSVSDIVNVTTGGMFDSDFVDSAIAIKGLQLIEFADFGTASTFWLRWDMYNDNYYGWDNYIVTFYNGGTPAYCLRTGGPGPYNNILRFQYWNNITNAWVIWGTEQVAPPYDILQTMVLHLVPGVSMSLYIGDILYYTVATTPLNPTATFDRVVMSGNSQTHFSYLSQIMAGDYDNRNDHFSVATITGNSAVHTSGTGTYTDINELVLDDSTSVILDTVGYKKGFTVSGIVVPPGLGISGMVVNARSRVSGGVLTDGKVGVRSGGTDESSAGLNCAGAYEGRGAFFDENPATSGSWNQTSANAAEFYVEAS